MSAPAGVNWLNIPEELRARPQWCVAAENKMPMVLNETRTELVAAKVNENVFMTFEWAASVAYQTGNHIGYIITAEDPFCCIDLDVKDTTTPQEMQEYIDIVNVFDSYSEFSRSGRGMHIWLRGSIGMGARLGGIEVYSQNRFIICTGHVYRANPIKEKQELLEKLLLRIRTVQRYSAIMEDEDEVDSDETIFERAANAYNGEKFLKLCRGSWHGDYPSQSEADMALMSMFTFYSPSNEQCRRLFRMTVLGQRKKAQRDQYLDYMISMKRGQQAEQAQVQVMVEAGAEALARAMQTDAPVAEPAPVAVQQADPYHVDNSTAQMARAYIDKLQRGELTQDDANAGAMSFETAIAVNDFHAGPMNTLPGIPWPPGFAGLLAGFLYQSSPRPVKEIAIVATLGVLAGILGRKFNVMGTGLNLYVVLVARSGVGKEAMHSGIALLMHSQPGLQQHVLFDDFASGPAIMKTVSSRNSFVNVAGEFGRKLQRMSGDHVDGPMHTLRTVMTNLYQKSGSKHVVGGTSYSSGNKDNDIASVSGVAFSMIGESTPSTFFEALTPSMMEDGFLSRFTIIEYKGDRPPLNQNQLTQVPQSISEHLGKLLPDLVKGGLASGIPVTFTPDAKDVSDRFNIECDQAINSSQEEGYRQMWNRAHLKVLRIAGLLACADAPHNPVIQLPHIRWALEVVRLDIAMMDARMRSGEVGMDDGARTNRLAQMVRDFFQKDLNKAHERYQSLKAAGIVPHAYLQQRAQGMSTFSKHPAGYNTLVNAAVRSFIDAGHFVEMEKAKLAPFGFTGKAYYVMSLPSYI